MSLFDTIRSRSAWVVAHARSVHFDASQCDALAERLEAEGLASTEIDPAHHRLGSAEATLAYVLTIDAINFGSGWFPHLRKRPGCSGYLTIAGALRDHFEANGPMGAEELARITPLEVARILEQDPDNAIAMELMSQFARALRDLGSMLRDRFGGSFAALVGAADGRAAKLVTLLAEMPCYRDVARYAAHDAAARDDTQAAANGDEREIPFYKRAQITASDLAFAFGHEGPGRFEDLASLTCFADNLVPHVLRHEGVLRYEPALAERIAREETLASGSEAEVEIRAAAVTGVAHLTAALQRRGHALTEAAVDGLLWERGQRPEIKANPRHRTRCVYY